MVNHIDNFTEIIRIHKSKVSIKIVRLFGKEGDFFVFLSESLNVSGYGRTREEAEESFTAGMNQFCEDLMILPQDERDKELKLLGFNKDKWFNKNFSKAYIDGDGNLQNFEAGTIEKSVLETVI